MGTSWSLTIKNSIVRQTFTADMRTIHYVKTDCRRRMPFGQLQMALTTNSSLVAGSVDTKCHSSLRLWQVTYTLEDCCHELRRRCARIGLRMPRYHCREHPPNFKSVSRRQSISGEEHGCHSPHPDNPAPGRRSHSAQCWH